MERIWHHNKPAKRGPPTKTHGPGKEGIIQRGNKETKDNPEGAAKLYSGDCSFRPWDHFKQYTPQSWDLWNCCQKNPLLKEINKQTHLVFTKRHVGDYPNILKKILWSSITLGTKNIRSRFLGMVE